MTPKDTKEEKNEGDLLLPQERREYPRIAMNVHVLYRQLEDDEADQALTKKFDPDKILKDCSESKVLNLSTTGLLMHVKEEVPVKRFVAVNMYLPLPGLSCSCKALAEVIRSDKEEGGWLLGVKFLKVIHHNLNKFQFLSLKDLLEIKGEEIKLD